MPSSDEVGAAPDRGTPSVGQSSARFIQGPASPLCLPRAADLEADAMVVVFYRNTLRGCVHSLVDLDGDVHGEILVSTRDGYLNSVDSAKQESDRTQRQSRVLRRKTWPGRSTHFRTSR